MANKSNQPIVKNNIDRKEFNYSKGACNLNFTLRTDVKTELKDFRECLLEGVKDIDECLSKLP